MGLHVDQDVQVLDLLQAYNYDSWLRIHSYTSLSLIVKAVMDMPCINLIGITHDSVQLN